MESFGRIIMLCFISVFLTIVPLYYFSQMDMVDREEYIYFQLCKSFSKVQEECQLSEERYLTLLDTLAVTGHQTSLAMVHSTPEIQMDEYRTFSAASAIYEESTYEEEIIRCLNYGNSYPFKRGDTFSLTYFYSTGLFPSNRRAVHYGGVI